MVERMRSGRLWSATQRWAWASSRSSMLAKWRLASAVLVSGQRCSAGCSSGEYGGRKSRWTCSGTRSLRAGVPAGAVQDEHDLLGGAGADRAGEGGELDLEERDLTAGGQVEERPARGGLDEADEVAPFEAVLHRRDRPLPVEAPDLVQDGLQADAVLVGRPELDCGLGVGGRDRLDDRPELFLNAACARRRPAHGAAGACAAGRRGARR